MASIASDIEPLAPRGRQPGSSGGMQANGAGDRVARGLGWFSIGLGLAEVLVPRTLGRTIGIGDRSLLLRSLGAREIASGAAILLQDQPRSWTWARVAGDAMDLAMLASALGPAKGGRRGRVIAAMTAVAGVTALDVWASAPLRETASELARPVTVRRSIPVSRPAASLYAFWRDFANLPRVMHHLQSVEVLDERRWHWVASGPVGSRIEWDVEVTEDIANERLCWRSVPGADIENSGCVEFRPEIGHGGTVVDVVLTYAAPGGVAGSLLAKLFGAEPKQQLACDLRRFKQFMETGELATTEGQPSGRRSITGRMIEAAEPTS